MKQLTRHLGLLILLTIVGCGQNPNGLNKDTLDLEAVPPTAQPELDEPIDRKLIKEGQVEFETEKLAPTRSKILGAVDKYKAYVSSDEEFNSPGRRSNTMVIRIPADFFDAFLKDATEGVDKFDSKEITVKDVTEEFLDIQARLKTKKELEARYLALLKQAKNVTEILEIEKQAGELRSEIESIEGRLKYLESRVSFSTLTITFYERVSSETEFTSKFKNGFKNGWENLIWFFVFLTNIWPFLVIGLAAMVGWRVYKKKGRTP